jgi:hypothetical protein
MVLHFISKFEGGLVEEGYVLEVEAADLPVT